METKPTKITGTPDSSSAPDKNKKSTSETESKPKPKSPHKKAEHQNTKTIVRASKYTIVGIILTIFNFVIYTLLTQLIFHNNDFVSLATIISYTLATFLAYFLHSRITWRERHPTKSGIIKFFIWNFLTALIISPFFSWLFNQFTPIYQFAFSVSSNLHLPFTYDFVESTGIFGFTTLITMILNYLFYDRLVFDKQS